MVQQQVTVQAEQRFDDWVVGEVRTVEHTPRVQTLIDDGRVRVLPEPQVSAAAAPTEADSTIAEETPTPRRPRAGRRGDADQE
ncbi:hypothetical protein [Nocardia farcinica]